MRNVVRISARVSVVRKIGENEELKKVGSVTSVAVTFELCNMFFFGFIFFLLWMDYYFGFAPGW